MIATTHAGPSGAKSVVEELPGLGQGSKAVTAWLLQGKAVRGREAEARRAVGSLTLLQIAINNALCGCSLGGR